MNVENLVGSSEDTLRGNALWSWSVVISDVFLKCLDNHWDTNNVFGHIILLSHSWHFVRRGRQTVTDSKVYKLQATILFLNWCPLDGQCYIRSLLQYNCSVAAGVLTSRTVVQSKQGGDNTQGLTAFAALLRK